jgi:uncharacterized protein DUF4325
MSATHVVDVGADFTRFPAGRTKSDGPFCGEVFRDKFLRPWLDKHEPITVKLDSALAYGSSFLEEAFGGLIRLQYPKDEVLSLVKLETADPILKQEIQEYINSAKP